MEEKNINQEQVEQNQEPKGWADVMITPDMPLNAIVHFANILNQRLCNIENNMIVNGKTLTETYKEMPEEAQGE